MNLHLTVQVPRSPDLNQIVDRFHQKLEPLLFAFQPELVQLQGRLVRHSSREGVLCRLNLHLPTAQLSSESTAATAQTAFRAASGDLLRQLNKHKQRLRETRPHVRPASAHAREQWRQARAGAAPARQAELAAYFGAQYQHLLAFVQRQIVLRERLGEVPAGWLNPNEVLDEVVVAALSSPPRALAQNRGRWLLLLAAAAIRQLTRSYGERQHGLEIQALGGRDPQADEADPEATAVAQEALSRLAEALRHLPDQQRHDLVLYLLEGFRPQELAQISRRTEAEVRESLTQAEAALRQQPDLPTLLQHRLPLELRPPRAGERKGPTGLVPQRA